MAQASIRTHGELFISPSIQNDRTAFEAAVESRKQPVILPLREEEGVAFLVPIYDGEVSAPPLAAAILPPDACDCDAVSFCLIVLFCL